MLLPYQEAVNVPYRSPGRPPATRYNCDDHDPNIRRRIQEVSAELRLAERDDREWYLLVFGAWSDLRREPCESCGTPVVLVELARSPVGDPIHTLPSWNEIVLDGGTLLASTYRRHDGERCRSLRVGGARWTDDMHAAPDGGPRVTDPEGPSGRLEG